MSLQVTAAHRMLKKSQGHLAFGVKPVIFLEATRAVAQMGSGESQAHFQPGKGPHEDKGHHPFLQGAQSQAAVPVRTVGGN